MQKKITFICIIILLTTVFFSCKPTINEQNTVPRPEKKLITFQTGRQGDFVSGFFNTDREVVFYSKDYYVKTDFSDGYALIGQNYDPEKDDPLFCSVIDVNGTTYY